MPSLPANLDWLFLAIGALLALSALYLLFWSLFLDRGRARAAFRCPRCWYDLTPPDGAPPPLPITCSECGRSITKPRDLHKRRRKWRYALLALILLPSSGAIAYYPTAQRNGWLSIVPARLLIDSVPVFGYPSVVTDEIVLRWSNQQFVQGSGPSRFTVADQVYLLHRIVDGIGSTRPLSSKWKRTYGALLHDNRIWLVPAATGLRTPVQQLDPSLKAAMFRLFELPPEFTMRTRRIWPREFPLWIESTRAEWWPPSFAISTMVRDRRSDKWRAMPDGGFLVSPSSLEPQGALTFEIRAEWAGKGRHASGKQHGAEFVVPVPYHIVGSTSDILTPVIDPAIDQLVASMTYSSDWTAHLRIGPTCVPQTRGIGFGVLIELSRAGVLQAVERAWWMGDAQPKQHGWESYGHEFVFDDPRLGPVGDRQHPSGAKPGENWTVRIRSDPETALRVIDADRYWQGDVTIPLTIR